MSDGTFYVWVLKYGGMTVSETEQPVALEYENAKLQKLIAEQMLNSAVMKDLLSKMCQVTATFAYLSDLMFYCDGRNG